MLSECAFQPVFSLRRRLNAALLASALLLAGCAAPPAEEPLAQPELASGYGDKPGWATKRFAVAAANPLATLAGYRMLKAGGSALDAAVAVQMVLTLVEPQSSGIGGGAFLLYFDGQRSEAYDGRETAPAAATEDLFLGSNGRPLPFQQAVVGGRSVGTPGSVAMLELAHRQHGKLPWARLFEPAIALAEGGFPVSPRLHDLLAGEQALKRDPVAAAYFYDSQGQPWPVGHTLKNPELGAVLRRIAANGAQALYQGEVARAIVDKVQRHPTNPGTLALGDLAGYRPVQREPLCFVHRGAAVTGAVPSYRICGMPPPSSGTIAIGQILGMLERLPPVAKPLDEGVNTALLQCVRAPCPGHLPTGAPSAAWLHQYAEASRLAFADRAQYLGDPDFVTAPGNNWLSLLDPTYLNSRAELVLAAPAGGRMPEAKAGLPAPVKTSYAPMAQQPEYGTSHISIVDGWGHALAMTTTIEDGWGARLMVNRGKGLSGGFLLNNELTDFSFEPRDPNGTPIANRVQPGKRPRSSMSPSLVFALNPDGSTGPLVLSAGSPGGALIIHFTAKTLYGVLNWGLDPQQAINLPNFATLGGPVLLEQRRFAPTILQALRARGHQVVEAPLPSGLQAIQRVQGGYFSGADPRREGVVMGD